MKVTVTRKLPGCPEALLSRHFHDVIQLDAPRSLTAEALGQAASSTDVLICTLSDKITEKVLEQAPSLKCLITFSVGLDHIDVPAVLKRNIRLVHTPQVLTESTADLTWALILACARRLKPAMRYLEEGNFVGFDPSLFLGIELHGKLLGIVGMGKIGRAVATRGLGFGMKIAYSGPQRSDPYGTAVEMSLEQLLGNADVVALHCPLKKETTHLIGRRELSVMKPNAILVNTARGPIVDEAALVAHLRTHPDFFAGLDVFEKEPHLAEALKSLPNAFCVPHIGSATQVAREAMGKVCLDEAIRFARGESLKYEYHPTN